MTHLRVLRNSVTEQDTAATAASKPKTPGDFNKAAQKELQGSPIVARAHELRKVLGLQYECARVSAAKPLLKRVTTKKDEQAGTTKIRYKFEDASVEARVQLDENGGSVWEYFVPIADITFETATANPVGGPEYYWSRQKNGHSSNASDLIELIPAPELGPGFQGQLAAIAFDRGVSEELKRERRRQMEAELLVRDQIQPLIDEKKRELKQQYKGIGESGWAKKERNLRLVRTEQRGSEIAEIYRVDQHYLEVSQTSTKYRLEVVVFRTDLDGPFTRTVEFRWVGDTSSPK